MDVPSHLGGKVVQIEVTISNNSALFVFQKLNKVYEL